MTEIKEEQTLVIIKPDAIQRNLLGEIIGRLEKKGLKIIGLNDKVLGRCNRWFGHRDGCRE